MDPRGKLFWDGFVNGDARAQREFVDWALPMLMRFLRWKFHCSPADAEEWAGETISRAVKYASTYDRIRPILPWLFTIAVRIPPPPKAHGHAAMDPEIPAPISDPSERADAAMNLLRIDERVREAVRRGEVTEDFGKWYFALREFDFDAGKAAVKLGTRKRNMDVYKHRVRKWLKHQFPDLW